MAYRHLFSSVMFAVSVVAASFGWADEDTAVQRWAIVAANGLDEDGLVDLLTARLSKDESLQLVERADVVGVLDELSLQASGLVDPKQAVEFGQIVSADAILVIEKSAEGDASWLYARLVETKSGIRLWSGLAPRTNDDDACDVIMNQLRSARGKMETGRERRYIGILDVKSEDFDDYSDIFARAIRLMLEHDLQQSPQLVILEREQALRLLKEHDLTGIELELRAATVLIEGGVRRVASSGDRIVSLRLIAPAAGVSRDLSVVLPADGWDRIRREVHEACLKTLARFHGVNATEAREDQKTAANEAALFRLRSEWRVSHRQTEDATALAEAAFSLEPSLANYRQVKLCYGCLLADSRRKTIDRLQAALRYHQVGDLYLRHGIRDDPKAVDDPEWCIFGGDYKPMEMGAAERRVFEETRRLRQSKYQWLLNVRRAAGEDITGLLGARIGTALYMTDSAEKFMDDIRSLIVELDRETAADRFKRSMANPPFDFFFGNLQQQIEYAVKVIPNASRRHHGLVAVPGNWGPEGILPLLEWLVHHKDPRTRMLGHYGLCGLGGAPGVSAARTVLNTWLDDLTEKDARDSSSSLVDRAIERLRAEGRFVEYVERRIQAAEQSSDIANFCKWNSLAAICMLNRHPQKTTEWCERILHLVDAHQTTDAALARKAQGLSRLLKMNLDRRYRRGDFAPTTDAGWAGYNVRRLPVPVPTSILKYLLRVAVDQDSASEHPIVAVWRGPQERGKSLLDGSRITVTRLGLHGRDLVEVGRFRKPGFSVTCMAVGGDNVFLGERTLGIAQVGPQGVRHFGEEQGLPQAKVEGLAWLEPYVYLAYAGAFGRLDPRSGEFRLLASSRTVHARSPLDGGRSYDVISLFSDPKRGCVWFCVCEWVKGYGRSGIWKYTPQNGDFQHAFKGTVGHLVRTDEGFLYKSYSREGSREIWKVFNIQTGDSRTLDGVGAFTPMGIRQPPGWAYLAGGVIGGNGSIYTADGENYRHPDGGWTQPVDRLGRGLIAASFDRRAFWHIEPKED